MIPKETLKRIRRTIRRIEIASRKVVDETLAGQYHSVFKGRGIEFDEVREYAPGDDVRSIDWNVTSRMGRPFTKQFVEERELTVMLAVDASGSMDFGSTTEFKNELAAEICALLALAAIRNNDKVGLLTFSDGIELHLPPRKGRRHALRLVREVLFFKPRGIGSDLAGALEYLSRTQVKRCVLFLLSDFMAGPEPRRFALFQKPPRVLARKHDVVAIQLADRRETRLERMGLVRLVDPESGDFHTVDTSSRRWREDFFKLREAEQLSLERFLAGNGIDHLIVGTGRPYDVELVEFFRRRARRMRR